jgi:hypothetical protein
LKAHDKPGRISHEGRARFTHGFTAGVIKHPQYQNPQSDVADRNMSIIMWKNKTAAALRFGLTVKTY